MRRGLGVALALLAALAPPAPESGATGVTVVAIEGRGWGHGVGMAQDGAYAMGRDGASTPQILAQFYPGTRLGRGSGEVRVPVLASADAVVAFPDGGEVRDARSGGQGTGFPLRVAPGGQVRLRFDGRRYSATPVGGVRVRQLPPLLPPVTVPSPPPVAVPPPPVAPPPPPPAPPPPSPPAEAVSSRPLWAVPAGGGAVGVPARGRRYRGVLEARADGRGVRLVNHVDVEQYLRGMGEVLDPAWPPAALRAQAIAARTYALRASRAGDELCDDQQCQVYLGAQAEYGAMNKAVAATAGQVLLFGGGLASTVYSANAGGTSGTPQEGFGTPDGDHPYLRAGPYPTKDPFPWSVKVALGDVAARLRYPGSVIGVRVTGVGPSGRALQVTVDGTSGPRVVSGMDFDRALGLRSTLFTLRLETAEAAPPPPPPPDGGDPVVLEGGAEAALPVPPGALGRPAGTSGPVWSPSDLALAVLATLLLVGVGGGAAFQAASGPGVRPVR